MRNKILIVHPSRERAKLAQETYANVLFNADNPDNILYCLSLDYDDPQLYNYVWALDRNNITIIKGQNDCVVKAVNKFYNFLEIRSDFNIAIIISDDMRLCIHWDTLIFIELNKYGFDKILQTCQPNGNNNLLTLPIAGRQFFLDYGTFYYPEYKSMFADDDLTQWAIKNHRYIKNLDIVCPHLHPSIDIPNKIQVDATFQRENSYEFAEIGRAVFERRKQEGFPAYARNK